MDPRNVTASAVMSTDVLTALATDNLGNVIETMLTEHVGSLPIVESNGRCIGIVTTSDVIRASGSGADTDEEIERVVYLDPDTRRFEATDLCFPLEVAADRPVADLATEDVIFVLPDTPIRDVAQTMARQGIHHVLVVDEARNLLGVISSLDMVRLVAQL